MLHIYLSFRFAPNIKGLEFHHFLYLHVAYDVEYVFIRLIIIWLFQLTNHLVIAIHNSIINIIKIFIDFNHQLMRNHISFMILLFSDLFIFNANFKSFSSTSSYSPVDGNTSTSKNKSSVLALPF